MVREAVDINERFNFYHRLNPHQQRAAMERAKRDVRFDYCPTCRRYCWIEENYCRECGCPVERGGQNG